MLLSDKNQSMQQESRKVGKYRGRKDEVAKGKTGSGYSAIQICQTRSRKDCKQLNKQSLSARKKEKRTDSGKQEEKLKVNKKKNDTYFSQKERKGKRR